MNIERRMKYKKGYDINKSNTLIDVVFDLNTLNLFCSYILTVNCNEIRRSTLINLRNLMSILNFDLYKNDAEKLKRIAFVNRGLEARIIHNLNDTYMIQKYINGSLIDEDFIDYRNFKILDSEECKWVNNNVSETLKYSYMYNDINRVIDICTRFKAASYTDKGAIVREFEELIKEIVTKFRHASVEDISESTFSLRPEEFRQSVSDVFDKITNPSRRLITGMQGFNELLGGAFESERVYLLYGIAGVGKSMTLLDIAYQMKKYNTNYTAKDPTKRPVIVYLTQENSVTETVDRLFQMVTSANSNMSAYTKEEVMRMLTEEGELYLSDYSPIDIIIKYKPNNSIDTSYLYTLTEDLEDEGYEVIALLQDHIKRIRPVQYYNDMRLDLGNVINEFKVFAQLKDCVVITVGHFNRDANKTIENNAGKTDVTRMLGRSMVGESMLVIDNVDGAFSIGKDYDANGNQYLSINRLKKRYAATDRDYISQPYEANGIKLMEDYGKTPVFKDTLKVDPTMDMQGFNTGMSTSIVQAAIPFEEELRGPNMKSSTDLDIGSLFSGDMYGMANIDEKIDFGNINDNVLPIEELKPLVRFNKVA